RERDRGESTAPRPSACVSRSTPHAPKLTPLLLGMGALAEQRGGLNRYVAGLEAGLARAGIQPQLVVASSSGPLWKRLASFAAAASAHHDADVVDTHFALYAFVPVVLGRLRERPLVVH